MEDIKITQRSYDELIAAIKAYDYENEHNNISKEFTIENLKTIIKEVDKINLKEEREKYVRQLYYPKKEKG